MNATTADIDNDQTDDQLISTAASTKEAETKTTNNEKKLIVHYKHEKRFQSCKKDIHRVYEDIFQNTPAMHAKFMVSNKNRRTTQNELIRKRPRKTLLQNKIIKSKSCTNTFLSICT
jgi:hypothetical protein